MSFKNSNSALLDQARNQVRKAWNNDGGGAFQNDGRFDDNEEEEDDEEEMEHDGGFEEAAGCAVHARRENSRPYIIISTTSAVWTGLSPVTLLNASVNLTTANYGNAPGVIISYGYPGQLYPGFLNTTINQPFNLGKLRVEASATVNIPTAFTFTETQYIGDQNQTSLVPEIYLNQFYQTAIEINCDVLVNSTKNLQYNQLPSTVLIVKLFASEVISAHRGLEKKNLIKMFEDPNTTTLPTQTVVVDRGGSKKHHNKGRHGKKHRSYPIR
jgi:hypothetical protein